MKTKSIVSYLAILFLSTGCASYTYTDAPPTLGGMYSKYVVIGYEGELKPPEDIGIVTTDGLVKVGSIDGRSMKDFRVFKSSGFYSGGRYQLHLLPGTHQISLAYSFDKGAGYRAWSTSDVTKTITVHKGQVVHLIGADNGLSWSVREADGSAALSVINADFNELTKPK